MDCYIFDIDGTIADNSHRAHYIESEKKDWKGYFANVKDDKPIKHIIYLLMNLHSLRNKILFISGRSDICRKDTINWIDRYTCVRPIDGELYMRKEGDHRPDYVVKSELLDQIISDGYNPLMIFDDRNSVVKMWRARGIPCCQVAEGNF